MPTRGRCKAAFCPPLLYWLEMAKLTREDILKLARLARLELSEDEVEQFTAEIGAILGYIDQLQQADLSGQEPTYQVTGLKDVMRPDTVKNYGPGQEELLKNLPAREADLIKVKRVLE